MLWLRVKNEYKHFVLNVVHSLVFIPHLTHTRTYRQLTAQLQEVRSERDQLAAELSLSRTELTSLPSQQALERYVDCS